MGTGAPLAALPTKANVYSPSVDQSSRFAGVMAYARPGRNSGSRHFHRIVAQGDLPSLAAA